MHCVRSRLTGTFNLLLANGAIRDLLFCFVLRLNSAAHVLAKRSVRERRFLLKIIYFPRNFCVKASSCAFLVLTFFSFLMGLGNAAKNSVSPGIYGHWSYTALIHP